MWTEMWFPEDLKYMCIVVVNDIFHFNEYNDVSEFKHSDLNELTTRVIIFF